MEGAPVKLTRSDADALADQVTTMDALPRELLTIANPKTAKGERAGFLTAALHLAPAMVSGRNVCPHATAGCADACLNTAGRGALPQQQTARIRRTRFWARDRVGFMATLVDELERHERRATARGMRAAARLNALSDLPWERFPVKRGGETFPHVFAAFPDVVFYDYTKWPVTKRRVDGIANYSLTFSLAENNDHHAADALAAGVNVAVVFAGALPERFSVAGVEAPVINGDANDLRFTDPRGCIVGLSAKGRALKDRSGFVRAA
jgi:hypothetical protein